MTTWVNGLVHAIRLNESFQGFGSLSKKNKSLGNTAFGKAFLSERHFLKLELEVRTV